MHASHAYALLPLHVLTTSSPRTESPGVCRDGFSNIVWSTTPQHAARLEKMAPEEFGAAVNAALALGSADARGGGGGAAGGVARLLSQAAARVGAGRPPQAPPAVHCWVRQRPASFPLAMQHTGRCVRRGRPDLTARALPFLTPVFVHHPLCLQFHASHFHSLTAVHGRTVLHIRSASNRGA